MRLLILLLVAVGVAVGTDFELKGNDIESDQTAIVVAYEIIGKIQKAVRHGNTTRFVELVLKAQENPKDAGLMMKKWVGFTISVQYAHYERDDKILSSGMFSFEDTHLVGRFVFERLRYSGSNPSNNIHVLASGWVLTDLPPVLVPTSTDQKQISTLKHLPKDSQSIASRDNAGSLRQTMNTALEGMREKDVKRDYSNFI